jgi:hypothetical protein
MNVSRTYPLLIFAVIHDGGLSIETVRAVRRWADDMAVTNDRTVKRED